MPGFIEEIVLNAEDWSKGQDDSCSRDPGYRIPSGTISTHNRCLMEKNIMEISSHNLRNISSPLNQYFHIYPLKDYVFLLCGTPVGVVK